MSNSNPTDMTDGELAEAKRYGRLELGCALADKAIDVAYLAVAAFFLARPLDAWLKISPLLNDYWTLRLAAMYLAVFALHVAVSFPLSFYAGHRLEHQFHLSTQTFGRWLWRYTKRNLLSAAFLLVMILGLYWLIWTAGPWWWPAAAAAFFIVGIVLGQLAPVLILPLFYHIEKLDSPELNDRLARLAAGTGLSIEGVYRMNLSEETQKANAMLAGLGRTRRVLLGDTLLAGFSPDEIEVIFDHEIGHHVCRHIPKIIAIGLVYTLAGLWLCDRVLHVWVVPLDYARLRIDTLPLLLLALTVFGMILEPLQNVLSRRFERQADRYALDRTGLKEAYQSAFRKLAKSNKDDPNPHWLDVLLFHSHPPVAERLAMAKEEEENHD